MQVSKELCFHFFVEIEIKLKVATPENQEHLFGECNWIGEVRGSLSRWAGIPIPAKNVEDCMRWIKNRQWRQFRKELAAALYGALIYYAWQARNWRVYRGLNVDTRFITTQIQKEIRERVLPSRFSDSVLDNWKKEKSKTTVKESTLDPEFNPCREKGSLKNTKREIGTKKRVDDRDYAWIRRGMLFPFMEHVDRLQGQTDLNDSTPADLRSAIEEAFLAENGVVEMLMIEINAAAGNLDHLRSLPRGVFEACDSNQDQECNSPSQARFC
uniref:SET domain protein n=1 Tax=Solanum tuberosum TaxID=4113 RepID=M1BVI2_SOLTU